MKNSILFIILTLLPVFSVGEALASERVAVRVTFPGETSKWTTNSIDDAFRAARDSGINIAQFYPEWGKIEKKAGKYDWSELDNNIHFTRKAGMKASLIVKIVDNFKIGHLPGDIRFKNFDDAKLNQRFTSFILTMLDRYKGKIEYLYIGNEIDIYFDKNRGHLDPYIRFYSKLYSSAKPKHPEVKFGIVTTYHDAYKNRALDIVEKIGKNGDILGFTLYPQMMGKQPADTTDLIADMSSIAASVNKKFTLTETGFSTKGFSGSEEKQARFIEELYKGYANSGNMDCLSLFILYDLPDSINEMIASSYGVGGNKDFLQWQGTLGVLHNSGKAKSAWQHVRPAAVKSIDKTPKKVKTDTSVATQTGASNAGKIIDLNNLTGLGGTVAVDVNQNQKTLVWQYKFSNVGNMSMLADFKTKFKKPSRSLSMNIASDKKTTLAIVLIEKGDVNYEKYIVLPARKTQTISIPWNDFALQQGHKDKNNQLNLDQIKSWTFIDTTGFSGKTGSNKIEIKNLTMSQ